ncbi:MAG: hypothetical protein AAGF10_00495 [Verrucomicrobiota bacterium]
MAKPNSSASRAWGRKKSRSTKAGKATGVILFLFGIPFAAAGVFIIYTALTGGSMTWEGSDEEVPLAFSLIFGGLFLCVGLGVITGGVLTLVNERWQRAQEAYYLGQPWMLQKDWVAGRIKDSNLKAVFGSGAFALFWNAIAWMVTYALFSEGEQEGNQGMYFVLIFPVIGVFLLGAFFYQLMRYRRYGSSVFELTENPGVIGGNLGGVILSNVKITSQDGYNLTLRCKHVHSYNSRKGTQTDILWEKQVHLKREAVSHDIRGTLIPVLFFIPYDCKPTQAVDDHENIRWELEVKAETEGVDYKAAFEVPVFMTPQSSPDAQEPAQGIPGVEAVPLPSLESIPGLTRGHDASGNQVLEFRVMRHASMSIIPAIFGIGMAVAAYFIWQKTDAPLLFPLVFLFFSAICVLSAGGSILTYTRIVLRVGSIELERRTMGMRKNVTMPRQDIVSIEPSNGMSTNQTVYYNAVVELTDGKKHTLPVLIKGRREAEAFIEHLKQYP